MVKTKDLRDLSSEELHAQLEDLNQEIFGLKNELKAARKLDKPHLVRKRKQDRARMLTLMTEREKRSGS